MDHPTKGKPPSTAERSFSCPHCGAYTSQTWSELYGRSRDSDSPVPPRYDVQDWEEQANQARRDPEEQRAIERVLAFIRRIEDGKPFTEKVQNEYPNFKLNNVHISKCYVCAEIAIWVYHSLVFPLARSGEAPNPDLPADIKRDFEEARTILGQSPRGAAALLRLCVQKLCGHLGEKGKNIDEDIASLVAKGLAPQIQQALDAVRVIGNEAVHPGAMDLKDDTATAAELLSIVNFIADEMITKPAKLQAIYSRLPPEKLKGIEQRNAKAIGSASKS